MRYRPVILTPPHISDIDEKIGGYCAELIRDGDCLQLGIGAVPDSILVFLKHKKDLGIHTEMFSDSVVDLVEAGVVTCARKNFNRARWWPRFSWARRSSTGSCTTTHGADVPVNITNNPAIIAKNDNMVSINSTLQVDLTGQAASESIGYKSSAGRAARPISSGRRVVKWRQVHMAFHSTATGAGSRGSSRTSTWGRW
jgi:4-hydroxybutyrate CoA-transferase